MTMERSGIGSTSQPSCSLRYFVDERSGCIAVRDRGYTDPDYNGLHADTVGVVRYWGGRPETATCPTCGHTRSNGFSIADEDRQAAHELCDRLNAENAEHEPRALASRDPCSCSQGGSYGNC